MTLMTWDIKKHWPCSGVSIVNFENIPRIFLVFHSWILVSVNNWINQQRSNYRQVNLLNMQRQVQIMSYWPNGSSQTTTWKETCIKFNKYIECRFEQKFVNFIKIFVPQFLSRKKTIVETISGTIINSFDARVLTCI